MFFIKLRQGLRVKKDCGRAFKGDPMLFHVLTSLNRVPFKLILKKFFHFGIISQMKFFDLMAFREPAVFPLHRPL